MIVSADPVVRSSLRATFVSHWRRWLEALVGGQIAPVLELAVIFCLYAILAPDQHEFLVHMITRVGEALPMASGATAWAASNVEIVTLMAALVCLAGFIGIQYVVRIRMQSLRYMLELADSKALTVSYLNASPRVAHRLGRERVISSILQDAGTGATAVAFLIDMLTAVWSLTIYLTAALIASWKIVAVALCLYALPLWATRKTYERMRIIGKVKNSTNEAVLAFYGDLLSGLNRSKLDALEDALTKRAGKILHRNFAWRVEKRQLQAQFSAVMDGLSMLGLLATVYGAVVVLKLELPVLLVLFVLFNRMKAGIGLATTAHLSLVEILPNVGRLGELLSALRSGAVADPAIVCETAPEPLRSIESRSVSFGYEPDEPILSRLNFKAHAGDRILITGPSGQGKSTFLELLAGLLPPDEGEILYNDQIVDSRQFYRFRGRIAFVAPDVYLFDDTLRNNLTIGIDRQLIEKRLEVAIDQSGVREVVAALSQGLETRIGINGSNLSLGQRQRVILARLYLKQPDLILLDEATANLDPALEAELTTRLQKFVSPEAIVIMVAHKPPAQYAYTHHYHFEGGSLTPIANESVAISA